ncbi:hypothetical protein FRX31_017508 [Thalictrum thalictroides]|uniref:Uncharacterized protein n=1 Tax=Thalictrum thalictroides TaxID=46969 RepID=A0A7J6W6A1_THATH|nr:hypothetical protein FRX31_017508 [Thalictrum thalictroides]
MSKKAVKHEGKFIKCVKAPIRLLTKARDFYVNSLTDCTGRMNAVGYPTGPVNMMPRSFSTNSVRSNDDEDFRELIRAASQRGLREKIQLEIRQQQQGSKKLPRSFTVGIGRIDEDKACEQFEDDLKVKSDLVYPRSKSYAVAKRPGFFT